MYWKDQIYYNEVINREVLEKKLKKFLGDKEGRELINAIGEYVKSCITVNNTILAETDN